MVVKSLKTLLLITVVVLFACNNGKNIRPILLFGAGHNQLIAKKYYTTSPIAELINMDITSALDTAFQLKEPTKVQIYATGEMDINLTAVPRAYFFKSDDIEIFFKQKGHQGADLKSFIFPWLNLNRKSDTSMYKKDGANYWCKYDKVNKTYTSIISIPWSALKITKPPINTNYLFNIAIGDNDDNFQQKAKIAWNGTTDPSHTKMINGTISFSADTTKQMGNGVLRSVYKNLNVPLDSADWVGLPNYQITHHVLGLIKNKTDLSASLQSYWTDLGITFLVKINDNYKGQVIMKDVLKSPTFHDYGWIENEKGQKVWNMHVYYAKDAGGAFKNQQIDTAITLKPGKYRLKYLTDESNSWNNWDDDPPNNVFYGIVLYKQKP